MLVQRSGGGSTSTGSRSGPALHPCCKAQSRAWRSSTTWTTTPWVSLSCWYKSDGGYNICFRDLKDKQWWLIANPIKPHLITYSHTYAIHSKQKIWWIQNHINSYIALFLDTANWKATILFYNQTNYWVWKIRKTYKMFYKSQRCIYSRLCGYYIEHE